MRDFNAIPNASEPVNCFTGRRIRFLGSNPGAITVQGSQFTVTEGNGISLVGGNITIQSGTPEGGTAQPARPLSPWRTDQSRKCCLYRVKSWLQILVPEAGMTMGTITLSQGSDARSVSANAAGTDSNPQWPAS